MSDAYIGRIAGHSRRKEVLLFQGSGYTKSLGTRCSKYRVLGSK